MAFCQVTRSNKDRRSKQHLVKSEEIREEMRLQQRCKGKEYLVDDEDTVVQSSFTEKKQRLHPCSSLQIRGLNRKQQKEKSQKIIRAQTTHL
ncbi:hypothetical protein LSTR_LSTR017594 [Laodelphax striatellus]|uniref:Uncharacterized protein n=1 Tax=Laodelphax striatellus TaxID=195883 RepID=A0A482XQJ1_LAOST|nr:hypothetical protein LSTR_LSTR004368 [Laodelphax striatellus]RZF48415.1 hypothetical protein LSTR_LSTR017594 [Laodelphax striatellus]